MPFEEIKNAIDSDRPVIRGFWHRPLGNGGHVTVIIGYWVAADGTRWVIENDPGYSNPPPRMYDYDSDGYYLDAAWVGPPGSLAVRSDEPGIWRDGDGDGIMDWDETVRFRTDPNLDDTDDDWVLDKQDLRERIFSPGGTVWDDRMHPLVVDRDSDGTPKELDPDHDNGGAWDGCEDRDLNGMQNGTETSNFNPADDLNPVNRDCEMDLRLVMGQCDTNNDMKIQILVTDNTGGKANITRVQLLLDGTVVHDSGPISTDRYETEVTIHLDPPDRPHELRLQANNDHAWQSRPNELVQQVSCTPPVEIKLDLVAQGPCDSAGKRPVQVVVQDNTGGAQKITGWKLTLEGKLIDQGTGPVDKVVEVQLDPKAVNNLRLEATNDGANATTPEVKELHLACKAATRSIVLVIDASGSMGDFNKMAQAKASAKSFLAGVQPGEEVALIAFFDCGDIRLLKGFTRDPASLIPAIDSLAPSGSTPLAASIRFAGRYMCQAATAPEGQIIVLTDGGENCGGNPVEAAKSVFSRIRRFDRKDCPGGTVMRPAPQPDAIALQEPPRPGTWRVLADHLICRLSGVAHAQTITATPTITTTGTVTGVVGNDTVTIIGFGVDSDTAKTLQEAAQAGGGTYYDAQDQQSLTQALRQAGGQVVAPGDANGDGRCTEVDALVALRMAVGLQAPDVARMDVNGDGQVTEVDALQILKWAVAGGQCGGAAPTQPSP